MQGIPEMREWQASFIPQEANRATIQQYSLDIGRPSHGSHWGFPEPAGAEAQTFLPILRRALIQSPLTDQSLAYSYVPLHANSLGLESFAVSASLTRSAKARPLTALRSDRKRVGKEGRSRWSPAH